MSAASLETTLELWASSLREVKERMRPLFTQDRVAASAPAFLDGLLGPERRKTGWMRAEAAGERTVAPAGHPWSCELGGGCAARHRARLCAGDTGRPGRGAGV